MHKNWIRRCLITLALISMASLASGFDFSELEKSVTKITLDNGLRVLVMERHDAPVASFVTFVNVGGVDDPKEYTGLAHMFEHMAFKGTTTIGTKDIDAELKAMKVEDSLWMEYRAERKKGRLADSTKLVDLFDQFNKAIEKAGEYVEPNEFDAILDREGVVGMNAGTGMDQTQYIMSLPSNRLELWMAMESERFYAPVLREMYRERNVISEERLQTLENNPIGMAINQLLAAAYTAHPYGTPIIGHMSDIKNYTREEAAKFYAQYYVPSNMIVAIVGDVEPKQVEKLAKQYFGRLKPSPRPEPVATVEPEQKGERRVTLVDRAQPFLGLGYHIPEETNPDWAALDAMADYLGSGATSLLYKALVKKDKIAANVGSFGGYPATKYPCLMLVYAFPSQGETNEVCEQAIDSVIESLQAAPIPAEEVEKIKARYKANFIQSMQSNLGMATSLASYENMYGDWHQLFKELDRINAVTADDIQRVAKKYLTRENRTVVWLQTKSDEEGGM
jgi:predicted Zn-dependent peptidase